MSVEKPKVDEYQAGVQEVDLNKKDGALNMTDLPEPVPITTLFRFCTTGDLGIFFFGLFMSILAAATLPSIMIVFGDVMDAIAEPIAIEELVGTACRNMVLVGIYGFITFFFGFFAAGMSAAKVANSYRTAFLEAVLRQDGTFFDHVEPGSVSLMLSDCALDIQTGLADKFASSVQGLFQLFFGFAVAFYYGPLLSLVCLACLPFLVSVAAAIGLWGAEDGIFGKEAYNSANSIASESLLNVRTVLSLNAETVMSKRYDSKLDACKTAAIRQSARAAFLSGLLFLVMFAMYGIGLWYGAELIADSTDEELKDHPPPPDLFQPDGPWAAQYSIFAGTDEAPGICADFLEVDPITNTTIVTDPLSVCACGLPWDSVDDLQSPECGCSYDGENTGFGTGCFTGGKTILVFFAIMLGGFGAGQVGPGVKTFNDARQSAAKMLKVIDRHPDIDIDAVEGKKRLKDVQGQIILDNMHFRYAPKPIYPTKHDDEDKENKDNDDKKDDPPPPVHYEEGKLVFSGCNLTIEAGQTVALVGESGCGKSTIAKLVQRFYDPTQGRILLDGTDLKDVALKDLRANIGVVSQEPLLFDKSIKENIRYGKLDATDEEIVTAAKSANAHGFISRFPDGYDTRVGPKGSKLSGGQKQRVAIARAILRNPAILILDEATSALDNKSEKIVQQALDDLVQAKDSAKRTTIVIAHRLSTVRNADKIVVLGSFEGTSTATTGSIILEQGSHDFLMAKERGFYKALVGIGRRGNNTTTTTTTTTTDTLKQAEVEVDVDGDVVAPNDDEVDMDDLIQKMLTENNSVTVDENTETESIYSLSTTKTEEKEEEPGFWAQLMGGGGDDKKEEEDPLAAEKMNEYKNRVWNYTKPEMPWILFGSLASILKGSIFPLLSIVFSEMITVYYDSDTERLREDALRWSYLFYAIGVASLVFEAIQKCVFEMVGERLTQRMRSDLFRSFLRQDLSWFEDDANSLGVLSSCLSTDVKLVRLVGGQSTAATVESVSALCFGIIISLQASWEIFLIMLAMVPILGVCEALQWMALMGSEGSIRSELSSSTDKLHETVNGIREVQAFSLESSIATELEARITDQIIPASKTSAIMKGFMMGALQLIQFSVYAFAFWFGGQMISEGRIDFEDFNTALWAMAFAASGLGQAAIFAGDAAKASAAVKNIFDRLDAVPKIPSEPWENRGLQDFKTGAPVEREIDTQVLQDGTAKLEKVNFAYPTRKGAKIFDQIDLTIPAGRAVALVGSSGSGKSTVVQLMERFYDPISYKEEVEDMEETIEETKDVETGAVELSYADGIVRFNGADMREADVRWIRQNMSLVGQEPVLFDDTIYNNIAMGKAGCTKQEVEEAAKKANAYDFIMKMENGFDSKVGTAGGKVSGGQKQRIAIARAIISNPKILLLDEATSALDNESEKVVQASLDALVEESGGERTTLIIAHRLSTIKQADMICVLENNGDGSKVCESGSHDELMELGGKYKALIEAYER